MPAVNTVYNRTLSVMAHFYGGSFNSMPSAEHFIQGDIIMCNNSYYMMYNNEWVYADDVMYKESINSVPEIEVGSFDGRNAMWRVQNVIPRSPGEYYIMNSTSDDDILYNVHLPTIRFKNGNFIKAEEDVEEPNENKAWDDFMSGGIK